MDLTKIGERTIWIDVDVIQADGGTRCAAISGGFVALYDAVYKIYKNENLKEFPIKFFLGAVSVGKVQDNLLLDLNYFEDSKAQVDMNVIMNDKGEFIEIQSSAEQGTFNEEEFGQLLNLAKSGVHEIMFDQNVELEELVEDIKNEKDSASI
ncbi:MAG: ribonuclease PH [Neofamilia sp.]